MATWVAADASEFTEETRKVSPTNLVVKIDSFSLLPKYVIEKFESRAYGAGGYKWKVEIYPNGNRSEDDERHVSVYLSIAETDSLPEGWEGRSGALTQLIQKWGFSKLISKQRLIDPREGFVLDDCCVFGAEVYTLNNKLPVLGTLQLLRETFRSKREWKITDFSKLEDVWISEEFCVGEFKWKGQLYPRGDARAKDRYVSMFVECVDSKNFAPHQQLKAEVCMCQ